MPDPEVYIVQPELHPLPWKLLVLLVLIGLLCGAAIYLVRNGYGLA